jgi:pilus assembly protein FimV
VPFLLLAIQAWALGLGDIRLSSALNQPLRAEIELLAATPEELNNLTVQLASQDTFARYDLDRPMFLSGLQFEIVKSGSVVGNVIRVTSADPITEPFVTFLVEASWSRGRLLREYTLLLDPPTFAPPPTTQSTEAVTAPTRAAPADSGQIQRPAPQPQQAQPQPRPTVQPPQQAAPEPQPAARQPAPFEPTPPPADTAPLPADIAPPPADTAPQQDDSFGQPEFDATPGNDLLVVRGDTLWGITQRVRPDSRLTINQTMLAIYEANPDAFEGNINRLRAGATLRIPSADDVFRISRGDAFAEVRRQNAEWRGEAPPTPAPAPIVEPEPTQPSLTLVPPDEEDDLSLSDTSIDTGVVDDVDDAADDLVADSPEDRIQEIEAILDDPQALIAIPDNELAALRQELAELRGEELPLEDTGALDDELTAADDEIPVDDSIVDAVDDTVDDAADEVAPAVDSTPRVVSRPASDEGIVDTILGYLNNFWVWIGAALVVTVAILVWFMRRAARRDDEDATGVWDALDSDEMDMEGAATESLKALARDDESIVVVETESPDSDFIGLSDTMEAPAAEEPAAPETMEIPAAEEFPFPDEFEAPPAADSEPKAVIPDSPEATGTNKTLEDTFSSETAINLDQSDPVAEADFHMAYGLYDQAADLINGALTAEPDRQDLLAKLCEIYFVWGNRDGFVDAAMRLKTRVGDSADPEWDKIVIMGQQIAADHEMFSGVSAEGVTKAVDLSFEGGMEDAGDLDIDFAGDDAGDGDDEVIDLGGEEDDDVVNLGGAIASGDEILTDETGQVLIPPVSGSGIDFSFDDDEPDLEASATREMPGADETLDIGADDGDAEDGPGDTTRVAAEDSVQTPTIEEQFNMEATGELPAISEPESPQAPPTDATAEIDLDDLGLDLDALEEAAMAADVEDEEPIGDLDDTASGEQLEETGVNEVLDADALDATGRNEAVPEEDDLDATSTHEIFEMDDDPAATGIQEALNVEEALAATGELPALDDNDSTSINRSLADDEATQLASLDDDDDGDEDTDVGLDTSLLDATGQTQILTEDMAVETATDIDANLADSDATMLAPGYSEDQAPNLVSSDAETLLASMDEDEDEGDFDFAKTEALPKDVFSPDMSTDDTGRMPGLTGSTDMDLDLDDLTAALKVSEVGDTVNQLRDDATVEQPRIRPEDAATIDDSGATQSLSPDDMSGELHEARTMTEVGTKLDLARAYVDMGDPSGARSILDEVLDEGDEGQKQQAQQLIDSLPS